FFVTIYDFFERRRTLLWLLLAVMVGAMALVATRMRYDERITGFFQNDGSGERQAMIFDHLKMMDKVVVLFSAAEAPGPDSPGPDEMIACADAFEERLMTGDGAGYIASITSGAGAGQVEGAINFIYENLPVYMTDADYCRLDSIMAGEGGVERAVAASRDRLTSPLGVAMRDVLLRDPLGMATGKFAALERFSSLAGYEIYDGHIFSPDMATMLVVIEPNHGIGDTGANDILISAIERSAKETVADGFAGVSVEYLGGPSVAVHNARRVKADTWLTLSIALVVTVLFILLAFRNRWAVLLITTPVVFGALFALSAIWLSGQHSMSAIAVGVGAAVLGIALSYSIHVVSHANHTSDPRRVIRELAAPLTVGSFTTIGAFLGLMFTHSQLLHDFGLLAALTLVGTTVFCLVFLPHILSLGRPSEAPRGAGGPASRVQRAIERVSGYAYDRNRWVVAAVVVIVAGCLFFYKRVGFDSDMMNLNYEPPHLQRAEARLAQFAPDEGRPVMFVSTGSDAEGAHATCVAAERLLDSLESEGLIDKYVSAADFLPPPSVRRERVERWNEFWGDGRREEVIKRVEASATAAGFRAGAFDSFYETIRKTYSPEAGQTPGQTGQIPDQTGQTPAQTAQTPSFLSDWVSTTADGTVMIVSQVTLPDGNKGAVYARFASLPDVVVVDRAYFAGHMARGISDDFNLILAIASALIFVALLLSYGRIELTLMAFMPMVVSWVIILGVMALLGVRFNIVTIILSTFIFGIGDDFSIFIMDGLTAEYRNGKRMLTAHKTAIFFSAFTIVVGLGVLIFARHPAMHSLAGVSILGIVTVIAVAYVLQPVLWRVLVTSQTRRGGFPYTLAGVANSVYVFVYFGVGCAVLQLIMAGLWLMPGARGRKKLWFHRCVRFTTRFFLRTMVTTRRVAINDVGETFARPAVVIANHQSFVDILVLLSLHPKLVMVTNSWVWRSPFFGRIVRYADFFHTADGYEDLAGALRDKVTDGYSVVVFPEGTRSADGTVGRFHKGAFMLAERLGLDIVPIVLYGNGLVSSKSQPFYIKKGVLVSKILERITPHDPRFGEGYAERAKRMGAWFRTQYESVYEEFNRASNPWFYDALVKSYTYKGPVLEWYMRVKVRMERSYDLFDRIVPRDAAVVDIGCGYGPLAFMLALLSGRRRVLGIDYDEEKTEVARHNFLRTLAGVERIDFACADALEYNLPAADVFILSDVLHYLTFEAQDELLARCFARLNPGGMVIVRDGDSAEHERHRATERTERWSTRLVRFNKTNGALHFTDSARITAAAHRAGFRVRIVDHDTKTSNKIYVCTTS
ncbi:MAG: 1-acyl-sn-glycerol-3-phosphate acyltransferase, partial [Alistipes sp.]|nr:1-acyl-sn-glycerol-3-phosphate acyltransferase [Alistipes sp.]